MNDRVAAFFDRLREEPWLSSTQRSWTDYLFHFTELSNIPDILESGRLLPRETLRVQGAEFANTANREILDHTPAFVKQCVRLYSRPRVPMLYRVEGIRPARVVENAPHCPVPVYLLFSARDVLSQPNAFVSRGNLSSISLDSSIEPAASGLSNVPFDVVYHDRPFDQGDKQRILFHRQAEAIVQGALELDALRWIMVRSEAERATLESQVDRRSPGLLDRFRPRIRVNSRDSLFCREWNYVEDAWYDGRSVGLQINADARVRGPFIVSLEVRGLEGDGAVWSPGPREIVFPPDGFSILLPRNVSQGTIEVEVRLDGHLAYQNKLSPPGMSRIA